MSYWYAGICRGAENPLSNNKGKALQYWYRTGSREVVKFNKKEYRDYIRDIGRIIGGFLRMKGQPNPALQETGLLLEEHDEHV